MSKVVHLHPDRADAFWRNEAGRWKAKARDLEQVTEKMKAERVCFARAWRVVCQLTDGRLEVVLKEMMRLNDDDYRAWFDSIDPPAERA